MNPNWEYIPFNALFEWKRKSHIKSGDGKNTGFYKLFVCSDTEIKRYDDYLESGESLIFGTGGKASCHFANEKFAYSTDCVVAQRKTANISSKFYYYYLRQNRLNAIQQTFTGVGLQHTSKKKIGALLVPVVNIEEQERIVKKIEELFSQLDAGITTLQKTKAQLIVYRHAVLKDVFDNIGSCDEVALSAVCSAIVDCPHSTPKWTTEGRLCLRTTNFKRGYLDLSEKNYVSEETYLDRIRRLKPEPGDVLFSREGAILGIACIIPDGLQICMGQRMMLLRTKSHLNNKFLMHYLNSPKANQLVVENVGGTASPHINVGDIKHFPIPMVSCELQEQCVFEIEARLSTCDSIEKTVDTALQQAEAMRQSILKQAFEGRL